MKELFIKNHRNGRLYFVVALAVMIILFYSSSMTYQEQSQVSTIQQFLTTQPFKTQLSQIAFQYGDSEVSIQAQGYSKFIEFFIRKGAHFFTYFVLGGSLYLGLYPNLKNSAKGLSLIFATLAATGYAATDEFHQMLTGGRTPLFQDVMLDAVGALTATVILTIVLSFKQRRK